MRWQALGWRRSWKNLGGSHEQSFSRKKQWPSARGHHEAKILNEESRVFLAPIALKWNLLVFTRSWNWSFSGEGNRYQGDLVQETSSYVLPYIFLCRVRLA